MITDRGYLFQKRMPPYLGMQSQELIMSVDNLHVLHDWLQEALDEVIRKIEGE